MKTQIIQIEAHDDYISVRDKMGWSQTPRILLVWAENEPVLVRHFDLVVLKRYSVELGAQLALVCKVPEIRAHARALGIPVYPNIRKAQQSYWRPPRPRLRFWQRRGKNTASTPVRPLPRTIEALETLRQSAHPARPRWLNLLVIRLIIFTIGVAAVLAIAALFIPSATIQLTPLTRQEQIEIEVQASPVYEQVNISGLVPAVWQSVTVEGRASIPSSGTTLLPNKTASGEVLFTNLTDREIEVPAGTVVSTQDSTPIRFTTTEFVSVPVGSEPVAATIQAILPGSQGNLMPGKLVVIEGPLGLNLTVTNRAITRGGSNFTVAAPTETDYMALSAHLLTSLQVTALAELQAGLNPGDILLSDSPELVQTLESTYLPAEPEPSDILALTLRLEFRAPVVQQHDLLTLGSAVLEANLPKEYQAVPETLQIEQLSTPVDGTWQILASWQIAAQIKPEQVIQQVIGIPPEEVTHRIIRELPVAEITHLQVTPEWWPRLPILPFRIQITSP